MDIPDAQIGAWRAELTVISQDIVTLIHNRRMYREIMAIAQSNPHLPRTSLVYEWMQEAYVALATMAVRRQLDEDRRVVSFARLLKGIIASPRTITRKWYVSQYPASPPDGGDKYFDAFDPQKQGFVDVECVGRDLTQIEAAARSVERFANTYVAHRSKEVALGSAASPPIATWGELDQAIDVLGNLLQIVRVTTKSSRDGCPTRH